MTEMADRMAQIADVVGLPLIADADTGYGNALNVQRTVRAFQRAGVAGLPPARQARRAQQAEDRGPVRLRMRTCLSARVRDRAPGDAGDGDAGIVQNPVDDHVDDLVVEWRVVCRNRGQLPGQSCSRGGVAALG